MARVFVTGSTDGLGLAAARWLMADGHEVVLHARNARRASALTDLGDRVAGVVVGDLGSRAETEDVGAQVNALGVMDAVIHNAGVGYQEPRIETPDGHAHVFAVNVLAPYVLTARITRPTRLVYLSSSMHHGGEASVRDLDWAERRWSATQAYSDSKLFDATLALAVARLWPDTLSNAVDPGWVATRMGGPGAPGDLATGSATQAWLAVSDDPAARVTGQYFHHRRPRPPHPAAQDESFQSTLLSALEELTGISLVSAPRAN
jgi:NAD(P)-dependent dehydrogenase (short-subunit alcohol dehydrogenase family)